MKPQGPCAENTLPFFCATYPWAATLLMSIAVVFMFVTMLRA